MRWRKKGLMILLAALLAMPGVDALAEEPGVSGQDFFSTETEQMIESVSGDSMPQDVTSSWTDNQEKGQMLSDTADWIIASGKDGNITWVIDGNGKLTVEGSGDFSSKFGWASYREQIISAELNISDMTDGSDLFYNLINMTSVDMSHFDTSNMTDMGSMFYGCRSLTNLDVSGFDTSNVTDMRYMFYGCSSLTNVNVSGFDTSNVTNMWSMFEGCRSLISLDMSGFDVGRVQNMKLIFSNCHNLHLLKTPYNVTLGVDLPNVSGTAWYLPDGTQVTQLPQNLNYSVSLTRTGGTVSPTPSPAPTPVPTSAPAPTPTSAPVNPPTDDAARKVQNFVSRMYTVALGRAAEPQGLKDWTNRLLSHEFDGAGIANGFIMSDEFKNRRLNDGDYVDTLYRTFFNREADQGGRATWLGDLASGKSRGYVLAGFVNSREFDVLCDSYGIVRGVMREDGSPINPGIRGFVERCYLKALGREGEKAGVEDWTNRIATGAMSAEDVAKSFFFSDEYINKQTDNEAFVETLYQTFMDRASDPAGKADWVGRLNAGTGRKEVLEGFSRSEEFAGILRQYGL